MASDSGIEGAGDVGVSTEGQSSLRDFVVPHGGSRCVDLAVANAGRASWNEVGPKARKTMKWVAVVKFIGIPTIVTRKQRIYAPFNDFCLNSELEMLGMQWAWIQQWERAK